MGISAGTYGYLSPEQTRAVRQLSCKSDVFSLGITMVEAGLGRHPTDRDQLRVLGMRLDEALPRTFPDWPHNGLLMRMLHPRPAARPLPDDILHELAEYSLDSG
jgi:serine/threonine protein kinase